MKPFERSRFYQIRKSIAGNARGTVLEIGSGTGINFPFYRQADSVAAIEPDEAMRKRSLQRAAKAKVPIRTYAAKAEALPFGDDVFDSVVATLVFCTIPEPEKAFRSLWGMVKPGGKLAIDWYRFTPYPTPSTTKYIWRPLTTRMNPETLLRFVRWYVPRWLPVDTFIRKLPAGKMLKALTFIPCANYYDLDLSEDAKVNWAVLDTFDSLGARYDKPRSRKGMLSLLDELEGVDAWDLRKGPNGWVMNFSKVF